MYCKVVGNVRGVLGIRLRHTLGKASRTLFTSVCARAGAPSVVSQAIENGESVKNICFTVTNTTR